MRFQALLASGIGADEESGDENGPASTCNWRCLLARAPFSPVGGEEAAGSREERE